MVVGHVALPDPEAVGESLIKVAEATPPVDLTRVVLLWNGLRVTECDLRGEGYILDLEGFGGEIVVRKASKETRKRYTIAHELGHWVLHKCAGINLSGQVGTERIAVERRCDRFAASLLIPKKEVLRHLRMPQRNAVASLMGSGPDVYKVSEHAFYIRMAELASATIHVLRESQSRFRLVKTYSASPLEAANMVDWSLLLPYVQGPAQRLLDLGDGTPTLFTWSNVQRNDNRVRWVLATMPASSLATGIDVFSDYRA